MAARFGSTAVHHVIPARASYALTAMTDDYLWPVESDASQQNLVEIEQADRQHVSNRRLIRTVAMPRALIVISHGVSGKSSFCTMLSHLRLQLLSSSLNRTLVLCFAPRTILETESCNISRVNNEKGSRSLLKIIFIAVTFGTLQ